MRGGQAPRPWRRRHLVGHHQQVLRRHRLARLRHHRQAHPAHRARETKAQVKHKLDALHDEIKAGIRTPATYTVEQCVRDWLDSLTLDPGTIASYRGQAEKWIYPKIGKAKLKDLKATDAERFFNDLGQVLSKRSLVMIKSTLRRSIRRAQARPDRPERGRTGRPARRPARTPLPRHDRASGRARCSARQPASRPAT